MILLLSLSSSFAFAKEAKRSQSAPEQTAPQAAVPAESHHFMGIDAEPLWIAVGGFGLDLDFRMSKKTSLVIGGMAVASHAVSKSESSNDTAYKWSTYEAYIGPQFMINGSFDEWGAYIFPAVGYTSAEITDYSDQKLSGSLSAPEFRFTVGYQFVFAQIMKLTLGGGFRAVSSNEIIVKDSGGNEVYKQKSDTIGGASLDLKFGVMF